MKNGIAIICDGKEISYGLSLLHLIKYENNEHRYYSKIYEKIDSDIYSTKVYLREGVNKGFMKVFISPRFTIKGDIIFDKYGMKIYKDNRDYFLTSDVNLMKDNDYNEFIVFANEQRNNYIKKECEYVSRVEKENSDWIVREFSSIETSKGLFKKSGIDILQQQFDCMAFVFINEILPKYID